jgi:hypothetical protein
MTTRRRDMPQGVTMARCEREITEHVSARVQVPPELLFPDERGRKGVRATKDVEDDDAPFLNAKQQKKVILTAKEKARLHPSIALCFPCARCLILRVRSARAQMRSVCGAHMRL